MRRNPDPDRKLRIVERVRTVVFVVILRTIAELCRGVGKADLEAGVAALSSRQDGARVSEAVYEVHKVWDLRRRVTLHVRSSTAGVARALEELGVSPELLLDVAAVVAGHLDKLTTAVDGHAITRAGVGMAYPTAISDWAVLPRGDLAMYITQEFVHKALLLVDGMTDEECLYMHDHDREVCWGVPGVARRAHPPPSTRQSVAK